MKTIQRREIKKSFRVSLTADRKEQSDSERVKRLKESGETEGFGESEVRNEEVR